MEAGESNPGRSSPARAVFWIGGALVLILVASVIVLAALAAPYGAHGMMYGAGPGGGWWVVGLGMMAVIGALGLLVLLFTAAALGETASGNPR